MRSLINNIFAASLLQNQIKFSFFRDNFRDRSRDGRKHDEPPPSKIRTRPCKFFVERGTCRDGDRCNFIHPQN